jgi:hypothetical protein
MANSIQTKSQKLAAQIIELIVEAQKIENSITVSTPDRVRVSFDTDGGIVTFQGNFSITPTINSSGQTVFDVIDPYP